MRSVQDEAETVSIGAWMYFATIYLLYQYTAHQCVRSTIVAAIPLSWFAKIIFFLFFHEWSILVFLSYVGGFYFLRFWFLYSNLAVILYSLIYFLCSSVFQFFGAFFTSFFVARFSAVILHTHSRYVILISVVSYNYAAYMNRLCYSIHRAQLIDL